ncbi:restriction endonuclease subunit S [Rhizobium ruizarguesonis]
MSDRLCVDGPWLVPESWIWAEVQDIGEVALGRQRSPVNHTGPHMRPYVRAANITWRGWNLSDVKEMNFNSADFARFQLHAGDVLVNEGSGSAKEIGKPAIWRGEIEACCFQNTLIRVQPKGCTSEYLSSYFTFSAVSERFVATTKGVNIHHIGKEGLATFSVPVPPLTEQRRIVAKIDSITGKSKRARDHLDHIPRLIEKYKQAVLAAAFRGDLTREWRAQHPSGTVSIGDLEKQRYAAWTARSARGRYADPDELDWRPDIDLPSGWIWASVDQLSYLIQYGSSAKTNDDSAGVAVLRMGNLQGGDLDFSSLKFLPSEHPEFPELLLQSGDLLFNRTNSAELVGKTAVYLGMPRQASFASYLIRIKACGMNPQLLSAYINSAIGREWVASVVNQQVGQANVNGTKLRCLGVPVMPTGEQEELLQRILSAFSWIDRLASEATNGRKLIDHLDRAVLAKAFRGELVPQDPADEPASVLLERIRADREAAPKAKRGRKARFE